jgi:hypothetical protein
MFQFPGFALQLLGVTEHDFGWVAPFGNLRITGCFPLPVAYRR